MFDQNKSDHMGYNQKHITFTEDENNFVYIDGISGNLLKELISYFQTFNVTVLQKSEIEPGVRLTYVFQKDNLKNLVKNVALTSDHNAKFILLISDFKKNEKVKAKKLMSQIHSGVEWYLVFVPKLHTQEETKLFIHTLFKKITSGKETDNATTYVQTKYVDQKELNKNTTAPKKNVAVRVLFTLMLLLITFTSLYIGMIISSAYFGIKELEQISVEYENNNFKNATRHAQKAGQLFSLGETFSVPLLTIGKQFRYEDNKAIEDSFQTGKLTAVTIEKALFASTLAKQIGESILSSRTSVAQSEFERVTTEVEKLDVDIQRLTVQVSKLKNNNSKLFSYFNITPKISQAEEYLANISEVLHLSTRFVHIMPSLLGYDSPKTFLVLFQNNAELRPTGGFIGSFGWATFSKGRLIEFKTEDVYTADGQLKGHVIPPEPLAKYLAQENWYLRDSNFDPDFSLSAQQAEWFLKHEMNLTFDGVIAVDLQSVQEVLRGMGGVYVSDYDKTIDADNLFLQTQSISELGFFPGSTQKRDFIGSLTRNMFIKMTSGDLKWGKLLASIKYSLDEKHMLLYLHDDIGQELIEESGWGGRLASITCISYDCIPDYLMIVEANLGINKSNFLVDRNMQLAIQRKPGILEHDLQISYSNESTKTAYPGGLYFSYTRLLLPFNAKLDSIRVGGEVIKEEDITVEEYQDKIMIGFPMRVPASTTTELLVHYFIPYVGKGEELELLIQKQPGVVSYPVNILVTGYEGTTDVLGGATRIQKDIILQNEQLINVSL